MTGIADRLPMLMAMRRTNEAVIRAGVADRNKDVKGTCSATLADYLRFFGVALYLVEGDICAFRSKLADAATLQASLHGRHEMGESIDDSYVSMLSYKHLFDALAAGAREVAESLAHHMGGRDAIEKKHDHPFDRAMGYTLRAFVLNDRQQMEEWTPKFIERCERTRAGAFLGYGQVFEAIRETDVAAANAGMQAIVKGHRKQSKGRGVFAGLEDEVLCVWGIGMANLARWRGLAVEPIPPLIPGELLVE